MAGGILLATILAVAHHLFYRSLDGKIVGSSDQQQWFLRIGTGLAFLIKTLLSASAALGYTQLLWHTLRSRPVSLGGVDSLFGAVTNAWHFTNWELWGRGPALAIIALIIWTLPLVAVITPATLSVQPAAKPNQTTFYSPIPSIDYDALDIVKWAQVLDDIGVSEGPSSRLTRLMTSVASRGSILPISPLYPNCTYSVEFYGPSLSCGVPNIGNSSFSDDCLNMINNYNKRGPSAVVYVGFVPASNGTNSSVAAAALTALNQTLGQSTAISGSFSFGSSAYDSVSRDSARLFITVPGLTYIEDNTANRTTWDAIVQPNKIIECLLYNASYVVNFTFINGQQDVAVTNMTLLNGVTAHETSDEAYGGRIPVTRDVAPEVYSSILVALNDLLLGSLVSGNFGTLSAINTQIARTVLMDTIEMRYLEIDSTDVAPLTIANISMAEALEQVFLNTTLSLFSDSYFLQNSTTASVRPILISSPQDAYIYHPENLFIAYGLGIFVTTAIVGVGYFCIWVSGNSFGASFSAILRTTRNPELDAIVPAKETHGSFPMSKQLGKTKLIVQRDVYDAELRTAFAVVNNSEDGGVEMKHIIQRRISLDSLLQL
ncbi:hypothetical protein EG329_013965 [Mollisiaceae sp. DMI_Dod_QoI]|nr:hypothetical protein EG329_013965 [Helotiales sp. DMI_Dod_QoI]